MSGAALPLLLLVASCRDTPEAPPVVVLSKIVELVALDSANDDASMLA